MAYPSYVSSACNQLPRAADWGRNNLICYAANNAIAIYDPQLNTFGSVLSTLHVHNDRVNIVRWIKPVFPKLETEFLSASSDGTVVIWNAIDIQKGFFKALDILRINEPTTICDAVYFYSNSTDLLICTGSINGDFRVWIRIGEQKIISTQILNFHKTLPIEARLMLLPSKTSDKPNPLLLIAMEDSTIVLYVTNTNNDSNQKKIGDFIKIKTLIGHQDWITCIDYILDDFQNLFVATGSQDNTIRLWKIFLKTNVQEVNEENEIKFNKQSFLIHNQEYQVVLESVIYAHDAWIYEVHWHPLIEVNGNYCQPMKLLSCSLDKSVIMWQPSKDTGIWSEVLRVGEVGGNSLGFYGCKFSPNGKSIFTYGYHGSFHMWEYQETSKNWKPRTAPSGHYDSVHDLCWDAEGRFLLTASADQTTRIHAPWLHENGTESWHEIARAQIHGYGISCLATLGPSMFASGAEEKVTRIFTAPLMFKNYLENMDSNTDSYVSTNTVAYVPALSLTNKVILKEKEYNTPSKNDIQNTLTDNVSKQPPLEEELIEALWPEEQKLYGHSQEIFSMAASHDGTLLATASKATSPNNAAIILWDTKNWSQAQKLFSHQLTVTQLAFSPNDRYLLSVSRDRCWSLFVFQNAKYELRIIIPKTDTIHTRIIWCCAWTCDSNYFASGSRDGRIGIWSTNINTNSKMLPVTDLYKSDLSITALAFAPVEMQNKFFYILAIGYESGCIEIKKIEGINNCESYKWTQYEFLNSSDAHHLTVRRLAFRPKHKNEQKNILQLASCGSDNIVKIHNVACEIQY